MSERSSQTSPQGRPSGLALGFAVLAVLTYLLIAVGALVRAHDAGLACPDWPLCKGELVPPFDLKVAFEWGHRAFAGSVSIGLALLSIIAWRRRALRPMLKTRLGVAWALLLTQVVFGGLTVLLLLAPWTVSGHLVIGNAFFVTLVWISRDLHEVGAPAPARVVIDARIPKILMLVVACLMLQIVLGGLVSSYYAGLACSTFPTCDGASIVPTLSGKVGLHVIHRLNGFALLVAFAVLAFVTRRRGTLGMLAWLGLRLVVLQIFIGIMNVVLRLPYSITALHTALAAAIVLTTLLMVRHAIRARAEPAAHASVEASRMGDVRNRIGEAR